MAFVHHVSIEYRRAFSLSFKPLVPVDSCDFASLIHHHSKGSIAQNSLGAIFQAQTAI
jgi:hypothetical protein